MSEEVRLRIRAGEAVPVGSMKIPMVDLPLGATEDRVCGTIDIEKALTEGARPAAAPRAAVCGGFFLVFRGCRGGCSPRGCVASV
jgi:hypothetical protein